jgi:hypothetical protein
MELCARTASNANPFPMHNRKAAQKPIHFLLNLGGNLRLGVGDLDTQLLGAGNDVNSLPRRDVVGNPENLVSYSWSSEIGGRAYSAAWVRLCIRRSSTSLTLLTRKALWPEGVM